MNLASWSSEPTRSGRKPIDPDEARLNGIAARPDRELLLRSGLRKAREEVLLLPGDPL